MKKRKREKEKEKKTNSNYIYIYIHTYIYICIYAHTHTHTHTRYLRACMLCKTARKNATTPWEQGQRRCNFLEKGLLWIKKGKKEGEKDRKQKENQCFQTNVVMNDGDFFYSINAPVRQVLARLDHIGS